MKLMFNTSKPARRLLHTSDVHLGAFDSSGSDQETRDKHHFYFTRVMDIAIDEKVDFAVIAGDFFDNARVYEETLQFASDQITRLDAPVVISPGNHDHVGPGSVYDRFDFKNETPNLSIMRASDGETIHLETLDVQVWGRSHTEQLPDFQPFINPPPRGNAPWQIGVGHGHYIHPKALLHHSFHIREQHLIDSQRDYIALGHWEQMTRVSGGESVVAAYSGAPEGLGHVGEIGGRVLIVDLHEDGKVEITAHSVADKPKIAHDDIPLLEALIEAS